MEPERAEDFEIAAYAVKKMSVTPAVLGTIFATEE
jgi:hypothetical protein